MYSQPTAHALTSSILPADSGSPLRVLVAGRDKLARAGAITVLGQYDDLIASEGGPADVVLSVGAGTRSPAPVVALVADHAEALQALAQGAHGVLLQGSSGKRIHAALLAAADGLYVVDDELSEVVLTHARGEAELIEPLTTRELEVVQLLSDGLTNKEIAQRLGISDHTVKFHLNGIMGKLGVDTRTEAVVHAARLGIVSL